MPQKYRYWLGAIFVITLAARLYLAYTIPHFTYESYFHLRQVDHITHTGFPLYNDPLSYGGRENIFLPLFHYVMSFFDLFLPLEQVAILLPNLLLASLTLIVYYISKRITDTESVSLFSALIAGFLPIVFTTNSFTVTSLFLPLIFLNIYAFLNLSQRKFLLLYLTTFVLLSFTSPATFLLVMGFGIYLLLSFLEQKKVPKAEVEVMVFSLFFFVWSQFLFFKSVLLVEGISFIWMNIPPQIISLYFPTPNLLEALVLVSILPFVTGVYIVYRSLFRLKNEKSFLLVSFAVSTTLLTWFRLIEFKLSLAFFGIILSILFASFYKDLLSFLRQTKIAGWKRALVPVFLIVVMVSTIYPAVTFAWRQSTPSDSELEAFRWLRDNTEPNAGVLALLEEGHLVTYIGERRNIMDDQFGLIPDVEKRFQGLTSLFTTPFQTQALGLLDQYGIQYLVLTPRAQGHYETQRFSYFTRNCFERVYENEGTKIYKTLCSLRQKP